MAEKVIVLGGGPAGYESALSCSRAGMQVTLIEERDLGGTCVHKGCIPTRAYLSAVKAMDTLKKVSPSSAAEMRLNMQEIASYAKMRSMQLAEGAEYMLRKNNVAIIRDRGEICGEKKIRLSDGQILSCDALVAAAGSKERILQNHEFKNVLSAEKLLDNSGELPDSICVAGGGVLGIEMAVILNSAGSDVTLTEKEGRILPEWDSDVSSVIENSLSERGITVLTGCLRTDFENGMFCIGRDAAPLPLTDGLKEEDFLNADWIFMAGDMTGREMTADSAMEEGRRTAQMIRRADEPDSHRKHAACLFTPLEAAMYGQKAGPETKEGWAECGEEAAGQLLSGGRGFVKAVMDRETHVLKGFHIVASSATEMISAGQIAVDAGMTAEEFSSAVFAHPTESELMRLAVRRMLQKGAL